MPKEYQPTAKYQQASISSLPKHGSDFFLKIITFASSSTQQIQNKVHVYRMNAIVAGALFSRPPSLISSASTLQQQAVAESAGKMEDKAIILENKTISADNVASWLKGQRMEYDRLGWITPGFIEDKAAELKDGNQLYWFRELMAARASNAAEGRRMLNCKRLSDKILAVSEMKRKAPSFGMAK